MCVQTGVLKFYGQGGYPDNAGHPEVQHIIEASIRRIRTAGKAAGFLAVDPDMAQQCLAWGANFVAVGVDTMLYSESLVITGGRLLRWKHGELIDTMPDNSVSASDIRRSKIVALTCWHVFTG